MDGATLTSVLHQRGVNVRYLGTLLRELDRGEERGRLSHIQVKLLRFPLHQFLLIPSQVKNWVMSL